VLDDDEARGDCVVAGLTERNKKDGI